MAAMRGPDTARLQRRAKTIAFSVTIVGFLVLAAAGYVLWERTPGWLALQPGPASEAPGLPGAVQAWQRDASKVLIELQPELKAAVEQAAQAHTSKVPEEASRRAVELLQRRLTAPNVQSRLVPDSDAWLADDEMKQWLKAHVDSQKPQKVTTTERIVR